MPHPKKRKTKSGRNQRRAHHALKSLSLTGCKKCGKPAKPHHICPECGYYNSKKIVDVSKKFLKKKEKPEKGAKKEQEKSEKEKIKTEVKEQNKTSQ